MPRGSLETLSADREAFPALALADDASYLVPRITTALGLQGEVTLGGVEVLNHKPGRRATLHYRVKAGSWYHLIGKWYRNPDEATRLQRNLDALSMVWNGTEERLHLPKPLDATRDGLVLLLFIDGIDLRELAMGDDPAPFAAAGRWLSKLHALAPLDGLKEKTLAHEQAKIDGWIAIVRADLPDAAARLDQIETRSRRMATEMTPATPAMIHRDFYPANLLWENESLWAIDFDQLALGDPMVDVASFVAQLEKLALREGGEPIDASDAVFEFFENYEGDWAPERLAFFTAYCFVKLAAAEVERKRDDWQEIATLFVGRAGAVLQGV